MSDDFLNQVRGDIPELSPVERFARAAAVGDVLEQREAEARRAERANEREGALMAEAAAERMQLVSRGYTDRQLLEQQAQREAWRQERIGELEAELDRLDPQRRAARRAESQRTETERQLAEVRKLQNDPFMQRMVAEYDQRQAIQRSRERQAQIAYHEAELVRSGGY